MKSKIQTHTKIFINNLREAAPEIQICDKKQLIEDVSSFIIRYVENTDQLIKRSNYAKINRN